jgi:hypothetical protein
MRVPAAVLAPSAVTIGLALWLRHLRSTLTPQQ